MNGDSTYNIMFGERLALFLICVFLSHLKGVWLWSFNLGIVRSGPDICGPGTKKVHVIFNYKGKNHLINKDIRCKVRP